MGQIVNTGTPPVHHCTDLSAPGRPSLYSLNIDAVWQCDCGKFWQVYEYDVTDYEGDYYGTDLGWREVKDAGGTQFKKVEIDPSRYLTKNFLFHRCSMPWCGLVTKNHRHYEWV